MLICATLRTTISTGTKNRAFGLLQKNPIKAKTNPTCHGEASGEAGFQPIKCQNKSNTKPIKPNFKQTKLC